MITRVIDVPVLSNNHDYAAHRRTYHLMKLLSNTMMMLMLMMMLVMMTIMIRMTTVLVVSVSGRIGAPPVNLAARCEKPLDRSREELPPTCRVRRRAIIPLSGAFPVIYDSGHEI